VGSGRCCPDTWWLHQAGADLLVLRVVVPAGPGQAAAKSHMDQFQRGWREVGSLPAAGTAWDGGLGACAPSSHFGAGNLKISLPVSPGGALTTCKCTHIFLGWPEWSFSSYLLFYLAALLVKTIFDSCRVLSAGGLAAVFCPGAVRLGRRKVLAGFSEAETSARCWWRGSIAWTSCLWHFCQGRGD